MTAITLVSVIYHYHINGLHLFLDTQYIYIYIYGDARGVMPAVIGRGNEAI